MPYSPPTKEEIDAGARAIRNAFRECNTTPFFIGRNGTIETEVLFFWLTQRPVGRAYPPRFLDQVERNAGVFPATPESVDAWCEAYTKSLALLTGTAAGWFAPTYAAELALLSRFAPANCFSTPLRSLEPYYVAPDLQWTRHLEGRRVAVVSSFADSIKRQVWNDALPRVWPTDEAGLTAAAPRAEWSFIRTFYAPATALGKGGWLYPIQTWQAAVDSLEERVVASGAEIALIGCGALGMILAGRLRARGISAIVLGGAIQVLFGIKGMRWRTHNPIGGYWNDAWIWPAAYEIPGGAEGVEGGCYWSAPQSR